MDARHAFPVVGVGQVYARAHDVGRRGAERVEARRNLVEDVDRLAFGIARADDCTASTLMGQNWGID